LIVPVHVAVAVKAHDYVADHVDVYAARVLLRT
jgi:hypothetical protein